MEPLKDTHEVEDLRTFEILNNPFRLRLLRHFVEPKTVKGAAAELGVPPTRLYYHVNLLTEAGILEVVATNKVGAMVERVYRAVARSFKPGKELFEKGHDPEELARVMAATVLDNARIDAEAGLREHFVRIRREGKREAPPSVIARAHALLTREQASLFEERLLALVDELNRDDSLEEVEALEYGLSVVFFPLAGQGGNPE